MTKLRLFFLIALSQLLLVGPLAAQTSDVIDRSALRVCSDPANLPFSNDRRQGFENKIADLLASKLNIPVLYTWFPQATGFIRKTLKEKRCDIVMGYAQGHELVLNTNHYYRSSYVMIYDRSGPLANLGALDDPRLRGHKIGIIAGTPPANILAMYGLLANVVPYHLVVDRRADAPAEEMMESLAQGTIQLAVLWGPIGGYLAKQSGKDYAIVPIQRVPGAPRLAYRITFGIRQGEIEWKRKLNRLIKENQDEINAILLDYGVPILDENDQLIIPK